MEVKNSAPPAATSVALENLPTIADQAAAGSCEAQSFGYCLGAYTAARRPDGSRRWSAGDPENQPSAAWLYHWQTATGQNPNGPCPAGSMAVPYAQQLVGYGAPSTKRYPYDPHNLNTVDRGLCREIDATPVMGGPGPDGARLMVGSYAGYSNIQKREDVYLDTFKALIRAGHAIAFTGLVPNGYLTGAPALDKGAFTAPQGFIEGSGHGQVIVGFDDSKGPRGAFLVQNSFGWYWNPIPAAVYNDPGYNGLIWYDYRAFFAGQKYALIMYSNSTEAPSGQALIGNYPQAPLLFIKEAKRSGSRLTVILHGKEALNLTSITVAGPQGDKATTNLSETLRYGYVTLARKQAFEKGAYFATVIGTTLGGEAVAFNGPFIVT
jgi:hypothetical protein